MYRFDMAAFMLCTRDRGTPMRLEPTVQGGTMILVILYI